MRRRCSASWNMRGPSVARWSPHWPISGRVQPAQRARRGPLVGRQPGDIRPARRSAARHRVSRATATTSDTSNKDLHGALPVNTPTAWWFDATGEHFGQKCLTLDYFPSRALPEVLSFDGVDKESGSSSTRRRPCTPSRCRRCRPICTVPPTGTPTSTSWSGCSAGRRPRSPTAVRPCTARLPKLRAHRPPPAADAADHRPRRLPAGERARARQRDAARDRLTVLPYRRLA